MMPAVSRPSEFDCKEYGHADIPVQLLLEEDGRLNVYDYLKNTDVYRVSFSKGKMRFTASSYVGVIPLNDHVLLRVKPRIPVANLTHMVVETGRPTLALQALRAYSGHGTAQDWMLDRFAEALIDQVEHVLDQGLYRQYVRRIGTGGYPRGKFDFHQTVARFASRGVNNQAVYEWHERTVDIPPNQCLKAALLALHAHLTRDVRRERMEAGYGSILARLSRQLAAFADVSEIPEHLFINDPEVRGVHPLPEPRYYYRPALDLALLILGGQGIDLGLGGSDAQVSSLLIEMNALFENYSRLILQKEALHRRWPVAVLDQEGKVRLYEDPDEPPAPFGEPMQRTRGPQEPEATPDIVFRMPDGQVILVGEVKNTAKGGPLPERSEVNQAVSYAVRYRLDKALVVRPRTEGAEGGLFYAGQVGDVAVYDYKVDLSDADVHAVAGAFADAIAALLPPEATRPTSQ